MSRAPLWFVGGLFLCVSLSFWTFPALAADTSSTAEQRVISGKVIANVNVSDARILSQEGRKLHVGFDLANQDTQVQALGIRFGFELVKTTKEKQFVVDTFVAPDSIDLAPGQSVKKEAEYVVPEVLSGDFAVWVVARNAGGLILGLGSAGQVAFTSQSGRVEIKTDSCILRVAGDKTEYNLLQGVDVTPNETLTLSCQVENRTGIAQTLIPSFDTKRRSQYGDPMTVPSVPVSKIFLAASEKKVIDIVIPKASSPQAYDVRVVLRNESNPDMASNAINAHYVVRGVSATIQNISFDRSSFRTGESVKAVLFWSPSADQFLGSRAGSGTKIEEIIATLDIQSENGVACIDPLTQTVAGDVAMPTLSAIAIADCVRPTATVTITDSTGTVLDTRVVALVQTILNTQPIQPVDEDVFVRGGVRTALISIGIVLFLMASAFIILRRRVRAVGVIKTFVLLSLLSIGFLSGGGKAEAVSWMDVQIDVDDYGNIVRCSLEGMSNPAYCSWHFQATVNTNKTVYSPGENIILSSAVQSTMCANTTRYNSITATFEGSSITLQEGLVPGESTVYGSGLFVAPSNPGTYRINLSFFSGWGVTSTSFIDITVSCDWKSGSACTSAANNCGSTNAGTYSCAGVCSANAPANESIGGSCTSAANNCGSTNSGTIGCGGVCSVAAPANIALGTACSGPANACGMTTPGTITCAGCSSIVAPANTLCDLAVCKDGCTSTLDRSGSFSVTSGSPSTTLKACFYEAGTSACTSGVDVTGSATWIETNAPKDAISFSSTGILNTRFVNGDEVFRVSYGGVTKSPRVTVTCIPNSCSIPAAKAVTDTYCPETVQDTHVPTGCDGMTLTCPGTRHCDYNVKEVEP